VINAIIRASLENRAVVLLVAAMLTATGVYSYLRTPVDALPDLSDVQVIVRTTYPGQAPRLVEDQVTYPLTTALLSVPGATAVRGYSFYGDSFVNVLFADGTDPYWARSRVLEYLSQATARLPEGVRPALGPDATGVGWIYQYALVDRSGQHDLAQLRSIQDWFLKFELQALDGVAEVATIGGMVKQYQVVVDPERLKAYNLPLKQVTDAIRAAKVSASQSVGTRSTRTSGNPFGPGKGVPTKTAAPVRSAILAGPTGISLGSPRKRRVTVAMPRPAKSIGKPTKCPRRSARIIRTSAPAWPR